MSRCPFLLPSAGCDDSSESIVYCDCPCLSVLQSELGTIVVEQGTKGRDVEDDSVCGEGSGTLESGVTASGSGTASETRSRCFPFAGTLLAGQPKQRRVARNYQTL